MANGSTMEAATARQGETEAAGPDNVVLSVNAAPIDLAARPSPGIAAGLRRRRVHRGISEKLG